MCMAIDLESCEKSGIDNINKKLAEYLKVVKVVYPALITSLCSRSVVLLMAK